MTNAERYALELVDLLAPRPGERLLDAGAGDGTITAELARRVGPQGRVVALERDLRLAGIVENRARAG